MRLARGEPLPRRDLPDSEDPWEQHGKDVYRALRGRRPATCRARRLRPPRPHRTYGAADILEDFEVGWAPVVELQLRAGDLDAAERRPGLADPSSAAGAAR